MSVTPVPKHNTHTVKELISVYIIQSNSGLFSFWI